MYHAGIYIPSIFSLLHLLVQSRIRTLRRTAPIQVELTDLYCSDPQPILGSKPTLHQWMSEWENAWYIFLFILIDEYFFGVWPWRWRGIDLILLGEQKIVNVNYLTAQPGQKSWCLHATIHSSVLFSPRSTPGKERYIAAEKYITEKGNFRTWQSYFGYTYC